MLCVSNQAFPLSAQLKVDSKKSRFSYPYLELWNKAKTLVSIPRSQNDLRRARGAREMNLTPESFTKRNKLGILIVSLFKMDVFEF